MRNYSFQKYRTSVQYCICQGKLSIQLLRVIHSPSVPYVIPFVFIRLSLNTMGVLTPTVENASLLSHQTVTLAKVVLFVCPILPPWSILAEGEDATPKHVRPSLPFASMIVKRRKLTFCLFLFCKK